MQIMLVFCNFHEPLQLYILSMSGKGMANYLVKIYTYISHPLPRTLHGVDVMTLLGNKALRVLSENYLAHKNLSFYEPSEWVAEELLK